MEKETPKRRPRRKSEAATMADVARVADVSMQTVSRFLRSPDTVTEKTAEAIRAAIAGTHYVHNLAASHLASQRSRTVAAIIPTISASVFADTIQSFSDVLDAGGYQIFLGATNYDPDREEKVIRGLLGRRPDGIFIIGARHSRQTTALLKRAAIPVVEGWDLVDHPLDGVVGFSNRKPMQSLIEHLLGRGRRRIVFCGALIHGDVRAEERRDGFVEAMRALIPEIEPRLALEQDRGSDMEAGARLFEHALRDFPDADALVFSSDILASGALLTSQRRGISVPGALAITGFGDFELARHLNPALTTIRIPASDIGRKAGEMLLAAMLGQAPAEKRVDVGYELVIRQSA
jgi:LacI family transcriptional regulator, gluconate utilization system Gnt-I transcriptional repressor